MYSLFAMNYRLVFCKFVLFAAIGDFSSENEANLMRFARNLKKKQRLF